MQAIFTVVLPIFAIIGCGYAAGRFRILGDQSSEALNAFTYYFALPAVFFLSMAKAPLDRIFDWPFISAFLGASAVVYMVSLFIARIVFRQRLGEMALHALTAIFSNTGYMGIPLFIAAFGAAGAFPVILATVSQSVTLFIITIALIELARSTSDSLVGIAGDIFLRLLRNPFLLSTAAGLALNASGIGVAAPIESFASLIGAAAGPCALFALGLFMNSRSITTGIGEVLWLTLIKLLIYPAATWAFAEIIFSLPQKQVADLVLISALPTGALVFALAQRYGVYIQRSSAAVLVSTLVSIITLSAVFWYYRIG